MIPSFIHHGKVEIPEPCPIPWNQMEKAGVRIRFCGECKKVVHEITGMPPEQILALLATDPGNICVNFVNLDRLPAATATKIPHSPKHSSSPFRYIAASAAMWLLLQQSQAAPLVKPRIDASPILPDANSGDAENTLVSGIVLDQAGIPVPEEMDVLISCQGQEVARTKTRGGMFSIDLAGFLSPTDPLTVAVITGPQASSNIADAPPTPAISEATATTASLTAVTLDPNFFTSIGFGSGYSIPKHWSNGSTQTVLAAAQNITISVRYQAAQWIDNSYRDGGPTPWFPQDIYPPTDIFTNYSSTTFQLHTPKVQDRSCTDH